MARRVCPPLLEAEVFAREVNALRVSRTATVLALSVFVCWVGGPAYLVKFVLPHAGLYALLFLACAGRATILEGAELRAFVWSTSAIRFLLSAHACWCGLDLRTHGGSLEGEFLILSSLMLSAFQAQPSGVSYVLGLIPPSLTLLYVSGLQSEGDLRLPGATALFLTAVITTAVRTRHAALRSHAMQVELAHAREAAEAGSRAKNDFLANMSHELRTPLTGILGYAQVLDGDPRLHAEGRVHAQRIRTAGSSLLALVDDVLDLSRIEAGGVRLQPRPVDLVELVRTAADVVQPQATAKGLELTVACAPGAVGAVVDPDRLHQVVLNLLGNAVKFTTAGSVAVSLRAREQGDAWDVEIAVSDTGVGIAPELLAGVFQRFEQGDASTSRRFGGSGLGLAISQALVEAMGGAIIVRSRPGVGSTFSLRWSPLRADIPSAAVAAHAPAQDLKGLRVLVAEDVAVNRDLIGLMLKPYGVDLETAADGEEAVRAASLRPFDVILMDIQMPVLDGLAAARRIRAEGGPCADTRILALTANVLAPEVESCRAAGMDGHVSKPVSVERLLAALCGPPEREGSDTPAATVRARAAH